MIILATNTLRNQVKIAPFRDSKNKQINLQNKIDSKLELENNQTNKLQIPHKYISERGISFMKSEFASFKCNKFNPTRHESRKKQLANIISDNEIEGREIFNNFEKVILIFISCI